VAINTYETLLILDSNHYARDPGGMSKQISDLFTEAGANVLVSRLWMERKLEYPIKKHQKGTYWLVYSEMDGDCPTKLDRALHLFEPVLRQMTLKLDYRLVEPVLANARGEELKIRTTPIAGIDDTDEVEDLEEAVDL
jgi:small subunit ribosomal protein S6